ncbi:MAG: type II toxin-antitoxin system YafQ family toxin [Clostridiales bacterium]|jgi:mRNA interferase YafQ|nr:type II toxin-antitoxin system YafQ family toxin [Clostridiales bacterium]
MYEVKPSSKFKKDLKRASKRGYDISLLTTAIKLLADTGTLPEAYKDHALTGNWIGHRECHITPDWLLIYKIENDILVLTLTRTGTHSDLLEK